MDMNTLVKVAVGFAAMVAAVSMLLTSIVNGITNLKAMKILNNTLPKYNKLVDMCINVLEESTNEVMEASKVNTEE